MKIGKITGVVEKTQGEQTYIFGTLGSDKIKNVTFVPVLEASSGTFLNEVEGGYQRPGSISRMRLFKGFLEKHPDSVVPPVVLSGRGNWKFLPAEARDGWGTLELEDKAAVIDGQHRLGGFVALYEDKTEVREVSFILLPDLTLELEKDEFLVVNNTQKGVPKPLTTYLEDDDEAQVAWALNEEADSPFRGRITRTTIQKTQLFALHSVAKQVKRLFALGSLEDLSVEEKTEFASRFWTVISDRLQREWSDIEKLDDEDGRGRRDFQYKLLELTGLIAWAHTGASILSRSYNASTGMNWDNVTRLVDAAATIDWHKEGEYRGMTGEYGGKQMSKEMLSLLPGENSGEETGS